MNELICFDCLKKILKFPTISGLLFEEHKKKQDTPYSPNIFVTFKNFLNILMSLVLVN